MTTYYVMRMFSTGFSPSLEYTTTNHELAFNVRDDLEVQNPGKTYAVLTEAPDPDSSVNNL